MFLHSPNRVASQDCCEDTGGLQELGDIERQDHWGIPERYGGGFQWRVHASWVLLIVLSHVTSLSQPLMHRTIRHTQERTGDEAAGDKSPCSVLTPAHRDHAIHWDQGGQCSNLPTIPTWVHPIDTGVSLRQPMCLGFWKPSTLSKEPGPILTGSLVIFGSTVNKYT